VVVKKITYFTLHSMLNVFFSSVLEHMISILNNADDFQLVTIKITCVYIM